MWIEGRRRGGAKDLSKHLQKTDENESVTVRRLDGLSLTGLTGANLEKALKQMEAVGYGKGGKRNLYHAIVSPAYGETLTVAQQKFMVDYYAEKMGFKGHQCAVVEHWKKGKQHFHLVFNIIDPATGKIHELKWTKRKEWQISRDLEKIFGHAAPTPKGKSARSPEMQRGKRTGIDPRKMRKEVTAIFHASKTTQEFIAALDKAGYALTHGKKNQLVLVDKFGDTHGLMRRIEGKRLADLRRKFPGIEKIKFQSHADLVKARKPKSRTRINTLRERRITAKPFTHRPIAFLQDNAAIKTTSIHVARTTTEKQSPVVPIKPTPSKKGWPEAAIIDWKAWGHKNPARFFALWPELAPDGFTPSGKAQP